MHQTDLAPVPAAPNKHLGLSMDTTNAPRPKGKNVVAWQAQIPPSMTHVSASPNAPSLRWQPIPPAAPGKPIQTRQAKPSPPPPASPNATARTDHAALNKHLPPSVDAANAPHPKGHTLPHGRHTTPAIDDQPFGIAKRSTSPLTTDPASQSRSDDPVPIQSGRNSGPLILGIVTLHRPDWPRTEPTWPRFSLPRTHALALRTHFSRHDKHPFFANFRRPHGPDAPPP
ncbi:hypothetical protein SAMN02744133_11393 [Thalassospira xiamenensis M-5 = DSM 17429]|nr:hypothetical protein SAMN02744133_11393 [Thalassospira xiamenensis M-5 = DSM 17429]